MLEIVALFLSDIRKIHACIHIDTMKHHTLTGIQKPVIL